MSQQCKKQPQKLADLISGLLHDPARGQALGQKFTTFGHPNAARELAQVILAEAQG